MRASDHPEDPDSDSSSISHPTSNSDTGYIPDSDADSTSGSSSYATSDPRSDLDAGYVPDCDCDSDSNPGSGSDTSAGSNRQSQRGMSPTGSVRLIDNYDLSLGLLNDFLDPH